MRKFIVTAPAIVVASLALTACMSNNVQEYSPDAVQAYQVKSNVSSKVNVGHFAMAASKDKNHILCRLAGNVYLPNKMTYSAYIQKAFSETFIAADRYSQNARHKLTAQIRKVDFDSVKGDWVIAANVRVDRNRPVPIYSKTSFGTSWAAWSACKNVAQSFGSAVQNFVKKTLSNRTIVRELNGRHG